MDVKLISITPKAEKIISYCARVSNPANQDSTNYEKLLSYCLKNGHYSIFEMANLTLEITTSRAISAQILRHKSFAFQEFSQRYAEVQEFEKYEARRQDLKNRQNSIDDLPKETKTWFNDRLKSIQNESNMLYKAALKLNISKESARFLLPMSTQTKLYMNGSIRSWITYLNLRCGNGTQLEHQEIALKCKEIFKEQLPTISKVLGW